MKPIHLAYPIHRGLPDSALPISEETARELFTEAEITAGEKRLETKTLGAVSGLAIEMENRRELLSPYAPDYCKTGAVIHGVRTISAPRQNGFEIEGAVSIAGKKHRAFSSSMLFRLPSGKILSAGILYVCTPTGGKSA